MSSAWAHVAIGPRISPASTRFPVHLVQEASATDRYAQIIENIQRDDLAANEIAAFVLARLEAGEKQADIARKLGKPRDWVSRFAAIPKMPGFLKAKLHSCSIRAVYELYQAWRSRPELIEQACAGQESFTDAFTLMIVGQIKLDLLRLHEAGRTMRVRAPSHRDVCRD